ncbi:MAG: alpha-galactosidase [Clostridia bacterium]|nr:alpha-galactosidase [Clostridia bacterium]
MEKRKTPIMGWSSWNCFRVNIHEEKMKAQANALVNTGLAAYGYTYFNMDDGFFGGRGEDGIMRYHKERFPNGIRCISDHAHSLGLKAGIYAEGGHNTCAHYWDNEGENGVGVGLFGHEEQDLRQLLVDGDFDFIKVDWCGGLNMGLDEELQYTKISRIIDKIREEEDRYIVYNVCRWQFPGAWVKEIADSWRTGGDIRPTFESVIYQIDRIKPLRKYCGPGHVNDLDMMQVGNGLTLEEEKTHFAMWCMMSTPLMIGCDLTTISADTLSVLKDRELIAIDQDPACLQAYVGKEYREGEALLGEMWIKDLGCEDSAVKAIAFLNRSNKPLTMSAQLPEMNLAGKALKIRHVTAHTDTAPADCLTAEVAPHGVQVYIVTAEESIPKVFDEPEAEGLFKPYPKISAEEAGALLQNGAVLVDVRLPFEYAEAHLPGAVNLPYPELDKRAGELLPDPEKPVLVYCTTGKRSSMAKDSLEHKGYKAVYYMGGVQLL